MCKGPRAEDNLCTMTGAQWVEEGELQDGAKLYAEFSSLFRNWVTFHFFFCTENKEYVIGTALEQVHPAQTLEQ